MSGNWVNNAMNMAAGLSREHQKFFVGDILLDTLHEEDIRMLHMIRTDWIQPIRLSSIISGE
jgi:hypothetical protein